MTIKHCGTTVSFIPSRHVLIKPIAIIAAWVVVLATGAALRFAHLSARPFHADEATGARIAADRIESNRYVFDPLHYHGPTLSSAAAALGKLRGKQSWAELDKLTLRLVPAIAGTLLVLAPLLGRRRWGDGPMLLAAAFLATSPLLVYYSRTFIHEMLLTLFAMLALILLLRPPRKLLSGVLTGLLLGLMFATKESIAITALAWTGAGLLLAVENRRLLTRKHLRTAWVEYRFAALAAAVVAVVTGEFLYTSGFQHPKGAVDAIRTFFVYDTVEGHDKPPLYYLDLLAFPKRAAGRWWFETPVLLFAVFAYLSTFHRNFRSPATKAAVRFTAYAAAGHLVIYSLIPYKTPWLMCLPWSHLCLLAGFSLAGLSAWRPSTGFARRTAVAAALVIALTIGWQFRQTRRATGRLASDARNPYAYVPTSRNLESLETWLRQLHDELPEGSLDPLAVVGAGYWPLPWYLRTFERVGYWPEPPPNLEKMPLVLLPASSGGLVESRLAGTHIALPRGLRADDPLYLFLRLDLWDRWMDSDTS